MASTGFLRLRTHTFDPGQEWANTNAAFQYLGGGGFGCVFRGPYNDDSNAIIKVLFPRDDADVNTREGESPQQAVKRMWEKEALIGAGLVDPGPYLYGPTRDAWVQTKAYGLANQLPVAFLNALRARLGLDPNNEPYTRGAPRDSLNPTFTLGTDQYKTVLKCLNHARGPALVIVQTSAGNTMLEDWLVDRGDQVIEPRVWRLVAFQMMWAIHVANATTGLVHRDIKEPNMIVTPAAKKHNRYFAIASNPGDTASIADVFALEFQPGDPIITIIDLGSCYLRVQGGLEDIPSRADVLPVVEDADAEATTPIYRPPEFYMSKSESIRLRTTVSADLFAMGVVLYGMATTGRFNLNGAMFKGSKQELFTYKNFKGDPLPFVSDQTTFDILDIIKREKNNLFKSKIVSWYEDQSDVESIMKDFAATAMMLEAVGNGEKADQKDVPKDWFAPVSFNIRGKKKVTGFGDSNPLKGSAEIIQRHMGANGLLLVQDLLSWNPKTRREFGIPGVGAYGANNGLFHPVFVNDAGFYKGKFKLRNLPAYDSTRDEVYFIQKGHLKRMSEQTPQQQAAFRTYFKDEVYGPAKQPRPDVVGQRRKEKARKEEADAKRAAKAKKKMDAEKRKAQKELAAAQKAKQKAEKKAQEELRKAEKARIAREKAKQEAKEAQERAEREKAEADAARANAEAVQEENENPLPAIGVEDLDNEKQQRVLTAINVLATTVFPAFQPPARIGSPYTYDDIVKIYEQLMIASEVVEPEDADTEDLFEYRRSAEALDPGVYVYRGIRRPQESEASEQLSNYQVSQLRGIAKSLRLDGSKKATKSILVNNILAEMSKRGMIAEPPLPRRGKDSFKSIKRTGQVNLLRDLNVPQNQWGTNEDSRYAAYEKAMRFAGLDNPLAFYGDANGSGFVSADVIKEIGAYLVFLHGALNLINPKVPVPENYDVFEIMQNVLAVQDTINPSKSETRRIYNQVSALIQPTLALAKGAPTNADVQKAQDLADQEEEEAEEAQRQFEQAEESLEDASEDFTLAEEEVEIAKDEVEEAEALVEEEQEELEDANAASKEAGAVLLEEASEAEDAAKAAGVQLDNTVQREASKAELEALGKSDLIARAEELGLVPYKLRKDGSIGKSPKSKSDIIEMILEFQFEQKNEEQQEQKEEEEEEQEEQNGGKLNAATVYSEYSKRSFTIAKLKKLAAERNVVLPKGIRKPDIIQRIMEDMVAKGELEGSAAIQSMQAAASNLLNEFRVAENTGFTGVQLKNVADDLLLAKQAYEKLLDGEVSVFDEEFNAVNSVSKFYVLSEDDDGVFIETFVGFETEQGTYWANDADQQADYAAEILPDRNDPSLPGDGQEVRSLLARVILSLHGAADLLMGTGVEGYGDAIAEAAKNFQTPMSSKKQMETWRKILFDEFRWAGTSSELLGSLFGYGLNDVKESLENIEHLQQYHQNESDANNTTYNMEMIEQDFYQPILEALDRHDNEFLHQDIRSSLQKLGIYAQVIKSPRMTNQSQRTRFFHGLSIAASILDLLDRGHNVPLALLDRCEAERIQDETSSPLVYPKKVGTSSGIIHHI